MADIKAWLEDRACKGAPFMQLFAFYSTQFPQWFQALSEVPEELVRYNQDDVDLDVDSGGSQTDSDLVQCCSRLSL